MYDVLDDLTSWWSAGETVAAATVVSTWQSAPRGPGAMLVVGPDDSVAGSVSGGCVEAAVYDLALRVRRTGMPVLRRYGVTDDDAHAVGLTCGGAIDVFVEAICPAVYPQLADVVDDLRGDRPVAVATALDGPGAGRRLVIRPDAGSGSLGNGSACSGSVGSNRFDSAVHDDALGLLARGVSSIVRYGPDGERRLDDRRVFVAAFAPRPRLIVFGAIDFAGAVARIGSFLGYRVTVCDARATFATARRFPDADEVVVDWPHRYLAKTSVDERTVVCVLTHDPKFDVPLLEVALRMPLAYVGAMGSRHTNADRVRRLRERGITDAELAQLHAPIGLDVGARTPEEVAVSVAAEIVAARRGGTGARLRDTSGPIHDTPDNERDGGICGVEAPTPPGRAGRR